LNAKEKIMTVAKVMTNKWILMIAAALLVGVMANVSLADGPRGGRGDGYRGGYGYADHHDRDGGRDRFRGGDHWRGGYGYGGYSYGGYSYPVYVARPTYYYPPAYYGGGCVVGGYYGGAGVTIIIR
jgi:hypothetical protein